MDKVVDSNGSVYVFHGAFAFAFALEQGTDTQGKERLHHLNLKSAFLAAACSPLTPHANTTAY